MIRFALLAALFAAAPALAQTKEVVKEVDDLLVQLRQQQQAAEERNEDIEILRRLLNKAFGFEHQVAQLPEALQPYFGSTALPPGGMGWSGGLHPYGQPGGMTGFAPQPLVAHPAGKRVSQAVGPFDGVYLKGSGVAFTVRVPADTMKNDTAPLVVGSPHANIGLGSTCSACHHDIKPDHKVAKVGQQACGICHSDLQTGAGAVKALSLSDWELMRLALRGEKPPEVKAPPADPKKARAAMCKPGDLRELIVAQLHAHAKNVRHLDKNDWFTVVVTFDEVPVAKASRIPAPTEKIGFTPDEVQALTLGDLHLKQGKYVEAAAVYEKALARYRDAVARVAVPASLPHAEAQKALAGFQAGLRSAFKNLATAYLHQNEVDKGKAALDKATALTVELAVAGAEKPKPPLPAKLVLAVAKSDLDRGAKVDELRKGAHVEMIGFPLVEKK